MIRELEVIKSMYDYHLDFKIIQINSFVYLTNFNGTNPYTVLMVEDMIESQHVREDYDFDRYMKNIVQKMKAYQRDINIDIITNEEDT